MKVELNAAQTESLITSLLGFIRRVSFHGADSPTEAETLPIIVALLLGKTWLFEGKGETVSELHEEEAGSDDSQESENSGYICKYRCACGRG